jgi:hypothetical protein
MAGSLHGRPYRRCAVRPVGAVEANHGVEVDDAPTLVLGELGEGDPELFAQPAQRQSGELGEASTQGIGDFAKLR